MKTEKFEVGDLVVFKGEKKGSPLSKYLMLITDLEYYKERNTYGFIGMDILTGETVYPLLKWVKKLKLRNIK